MAGEYSAPGTGPGPSGPRATFGQRFVASFIDGLIFTVAAGLLFVILRRGAAPVVVVAALAYFGYFEGSPSGQTPGKRVMGIRVIDYTTGGPLGYARGVLRLVCRFLSFLPCYLGYVWMLWDTERQAWHDKLANAVVVPVSAYPVTTWP